jgi:malate synthase
MFLDIVLHACLNAKSLLHRQKAVLFLLRDVQGSGEAGLHAELFDLPEEHLGLPSGSIRATVMIDTINGALEVEEIRHEPRHHNCGLAIAPQAYAADHIALFTANERPPLADRETIGLNTPFLRSLSLTTIGIAHRRGARAIGAPAFVLPPDKQGRMKSGYLEMLADKEREAVDGHDGTIVGHPGLVKAAITEFNKGMPTAHQIGNQRRVAWSPQDLVRRPEGAISVERLLGMLRTVLQALGDVHPGEPLLQVGRIQDRSSIQLSLALLWQWVHSAQGVITASGSDVHADLLRYLVNKKADRLMVNRPTHRRSGRNAGERLLHFVLDEAYPIYGTH